MPLFNYGRVPGFAPGGRGISPETGRIGSLPGGMDYLAGFGPAPSGVVDSNPDPIMKLMRLSGSPAMGNSNPLSSFLMGLHKWGNPSTNGNAISMFNARHQTQITPQQAGVQANQVVPPGPLAGPPGGGAGAGNVTQAPGAGMPANNGSIGMPQTPWTPSWGVPGLVYGTSNGRRAFG